MDGLTAILFILVAFAIGDYVSFKTKATFSMLFTTAVVFLIAFWVGLPSTIFDDSGFFKVGQLAMPLLLTNMGTMISLKELAKQWKTVIIALAAVVGIGVLVYFVGGPIFGREMAASAAPPISGGVVAALIVSEAAMEKGLESVAVFATMLLVTQTFFGTPVASYCLKKEARRVLALSENNTLTDETEEEIIDEPKKRIFPPLRKELQLSSILLLKLTIVSFIGVKISALTNGAVNALIVCLVLGVIVRELGFIEKDSMTTANSQGFVMICLLTVIFANLASATPEMLMSLIVPIIGCLAIGVIGFSIFSAIAGKILGMDKYMSIAIGSTALFGFPGTFIISNEVANAIGETEEERKVILDAILPKMLIAGFVTVSIASVVLAGFMAKLI
ncbi:MAG TPA: hypothetical protein GX396_10320 [Tissierellia bacterium]|jgi:hypothetical protein|nr:hypothetical protein [Tissierellia bacterium]